MNIIKDRLLVIGHSAITNYKCAEFYGVAANRERARATAIEIGAKGQVLRLFRTVHTWLGGGLGIWLADITSLAMVVFGFTGVIPWWPPRSRRPLRAVSGRG